jgi:PKHD-type hydroxylase
MLVRIPQFLSAPQVAQCRETLETADWTDGKQTAGYLSMRVKNNLQVPESHPVALRLGDMILDALDRSPMFLAAALPLKILPPMFNRYAGGQAYGVHVDGAIRPIPGTRHRVRTDLSATIFLSAPEDYDGGELVVQDTFGPRRVKFASGDMVLYPGTSVHTVEPVTRGTRFASFFWIQSMVRDDAKRAILYEVDGIVQQLGRDPNNLAAVQLAGVYHNLLRMWAET